jgi:hypothetical protein
MTQRVDEVLSGVGLTGTICVITGATSGPCPKGVGAHG